MTLHILTSQIRYRGAERLDVTRKSGGKQGHPSSHDAAWAAVAAECPARASADAHRLGDQPLVHTVQPGGRSICCRPGERNPEVGGSCFLPADGLAAGERTTDAYRIAELLGRLGFCASVQSPQPPLQHGGP